MNHVPFYDSCKVWQLHPAVRLLLNHQRSAQVRKLLSGFQSPRRLALACLASLLAVIWVGQAVYSILFRQPAAPASLQLWIPLALLVYSLWHLLKTACRDPIEPFEWSPAEEELLGAAPLGRRQLVMYRLAAIAGSVTLKALCFSMLMIPDLPLWPAGFAGMFLALFFLDLLRMVLQIMAYGIHRRNYLRFRGAVLIVAATCVLSAIVSACCAAESSMATGPMVLIRQFLGALADLRMTWIGWLLLQPFQLFAHITLMSSSSGTIMISLVAALLLIWAMMQAVVSADWYFTRLRVMRERESAQPSIASARSDAAPHTEEVASLRDRPNGHAAQRAGATGLGVLARAWGAGTLAWRQALGARHYGTAVVIALVVPAVLSLLPLLVPGDGNATFVHVVGGLVFYSFMLLPAALKFDFRRDVERIGVLKSLPISATAVVVGQLAVPFGLTLLLELLVMLIAMLARPCSPALLVATLGLLIPITWLIFAMENVIFLLYPYRLNQEGVHIFLRSILAFTAKGILFVAAVVLLVTWLWGSSALAVALQQGGLNVAWQPIFTCGMWTFTAALALLATWSLARVYDRFDPSQDAPGLS